MSTGDLLARGHALDRDRPVRRVRCGRVPGVELPRALTGSAVPGDGNGDRWPARRRRRDVEDREESGQGCSGREPRGCERESEREAIRGLLPEYLVLHVGDRGHVVDRERAGWPGCQLARPLPGDRSLGARRERERELPAVLAAGAALRVDGGGGDVRRSLPHLARVELDAVVGLGAVEPLGVCADPDDGRRALRNDVVRAVDRPVPAEVARLRRGGSRGVADLPDQLATCVQRELLDAERRRHDDGHRAQLDPPARLDTAALFGVGLGERLERGAEVRQRELRRDRLAVAAGRGPVDERAGQVAATRKAADLRLGAQATQGELRVDLAHRGDRVLRAAHRGCQTHLRARPVPADARLHVHERFEAGVEPEDLARARRWRRGLRFLRLVPPTVAGIGNLPVLAGLSLLGRRQQGERAALSARRGGIGSIRTIHGVRT